jgi:hypothetical protein
VGRADVHRNGWSEGARGWMPTRLGRLLGVVLVPVIGEMFRISLFCIAEDLGCRMWLDFQDAPEAVELLYLTSLVPLLF